MALSHETYLTAFERCRSVDDAIEMAGKGALSYEALLSILSQRLVADTKGSMGRHRSAEAASSYVRRWLAGETLCAIAGKLGLPPTMLARVVLEEHLGLRKGVKGKAGVGALLKDPFLIEDLRLRYDVEAAIAADVVYGPTGDVSRRLMGLEYELVLQQELKARHIPFLSENELRLRAEAKTPDALLPIPLLVHGKQVHWIDSKATFGDPTSHAEYVSTQFASYVNRYAAGLVIYWFGFDESIHTDADLVVVDRFPQCELMSHCAQQQSWNNKAPG